MTLPLLPLFAILGFPEPSIATQLAALMSPPVLPVFPERMAPELESFVTLLLLPSFVTRAFPEASISMK